RDPLFRTHASRAARSLQTLKRVLHPPLERSVRIAQPPFGGHGAIVVRLDLARRVQLILEASRSDERHRPSLNLSCVAISLFGKRSVIAKKDDAEFLGIIVKKPVIDASLSGFISKNRVVGLHEEIPAVKPVKLFLAGHNDAWSKNAVVCPRFGSPPA